MASVCWMSFCASTLIWPWSSLIQKPTFALFSGVQNQKQIGFIHFFWLNQEWLNHVGPCWMRLDLRKSVNISDIIHLTMILAGKTYWLSSHLAMKTTMFFFKLFHASKRASSVGLLSQSKEIFVTSNGMFWSPARKYSSDREIRSSHEKQRGIAGVPSSDNYRNCTLNPIKRSDLFFLSSH